MPFSGQPVLVTGAGGFIGGHLAARLVAEGARVRAFVRYNSRDDRGTLDWLDPDVLAEVEVVLGDLRDVESVAAARSTGAEIVFHLGGADRDPVLVRQPARLLRDQRARHAERRPGGAAARASQRVVHTSTSEVYGSARTVPITEDHPLEPQSPYAASKIGADKLMDSFAPHLRPAGDGPAAVQHLRPAPVGPRDHPDDHQPGARRRPAAARLAAPAARPDLRRRHRRRLPRRRRVRTPRSAGRCSSAPATTSRSASIVEMVGEILGRELEVEHRPGARAPGRESRSSGSSPTPRWPRELTGLGARRSTCARALARTIEWIERQHGPLPRRTTT